MLPIGFSQMIEDILVQWTFIGYARHIFWLLFINCLIKFIGTKKRIKSQKNPYIQNIRNKLFFQISLRILQKLLLYYVEIR